MTRRMEKVADLVQAETADLLARHVKHPALIDAMVSITHVEVAPDLSSARLHVSVMGGEQSEDEVLEALARSEPFIHRELGKRLHMRRIPRLKFIADHSLAEGDRLSSMMRDLARDEGRDWELRES